MTPREEVYSALSATGVPGTWMAWPTGKAPDLPWFVYMQEESGAFHADNSNYSSLPRMRVELYQEAPDPELEGRFEAAIGELSPFERYDTWSDSENVGVTAFEFTYTPRKDTDNG